MYPLNMQQGSCCHLSEAELLLLCEKIRDGIANSAEMQQQAAAIEYTRVAERWKCCRSEGWGGAWLIEVARGFDQKCRLDNHGSS